MIKSFKSQDLEISKEWSSCQIKESESIKKETRLASLRNKIKRHCSSKAHNEALSILTQKESNILSKQFEKSAHKLHNSTLLVFRTAYYLAKNNRPFNDHFNLIELQNLNGVKLGNTLHSRFSSTNIIEHVSREMKLKIVKNITETGAKLSVLIDESTTISALCGMIVFIKCAISCGEPIFVFLDVVELECQTAENIVNQLINCLHKSGFNEHYLKENWISFVSDGASVLLGKKNGVAKRLKDRYPLILNWHCMNHRLELAVNDSVRDVNATNHFKTFIDSLYVLYNASPKNQNELKIICNELDIIFLKIGRVLDVRWVSSSLRAVTVVWKMYEALCNHFDEASVDFSRDSRTRAKYGGLKKKLASPEFLVDLALMCDCLHELSNLSQILQNRSLTLIEAHQSINRTIRVLASFKTIHGDYTTEATTAVKEMTFKNIKLIKNSKLININQNQFITSLTNNLTQRLLENEKDLTVLKDMLIMDTSKWPKEIDMRFGENEIKRLCLRFALNKDVAINGFRQLIDDRTISLDKCMPEFTNCLKTFPCSTAECERGFSLMNNICTKLRASLTMKNIANLMFININGPPIKDWKPEEYVKSWLVHHRSAEDTRTKNSKNYVSKPTEQLSKECLWNIL